LPEFKTEATRNCDLAPRVPKPKASQVLTADAPVRVVKLNPQTPGATMNANLLKINRIVRDNPEADLLNLFPPLYREQLKQASPYNKRASLFVQLYGLVPTNYYRL